MKNFSKFYIVVILLLSIFFISGAIVFAQSFIQPEASIPSSTGVLLKTQKLAQKDIVQKTNASKEIIRRTDSLYQLLTRIQEMKKLSDADKTLLINQANEQVIALGTLKVNIDADTDPAILKSDRQSMANQYRIYMLFIPRIQVLASADRIIEITDDISVLITKFQDRLTQVAINGKDVTTLQATLGDMQTKITDANVQAQSAQALVASLVSDNGDANIAKSNQKALQDARAKLVLAKKDITDIQKDIQTIRKALTTEKLKTSTSSASPSASSSALRR